MAYTSLASKKSVQATINALKDKGYLVEVFADRKSALAKIKSLIPSGVSVMNGSSVSLEQIGYVDFLEKGEHEWIDLKAKINAEEDQEKRAQLRKESVLSDYYLGSVHALVENGEFIIASNTGSQLPHVVYTSPHLIFVVSTKKIVPTLEAGLERLTEHVVPLEDQHMQDLYNVHTELNKIVIFKNESSMLDRTVTFLLVEEDIGF